MAFGFNNGGGGTITPRIKYNAKAGRMYRVDRTQDPATNQWETTEEDITDKTAFLLDLASFEHGWVSFAGPIPKDVYVPVTGDLPERPSDEMDEHGKPIWRPTLRFKVKLAQQAGGDLREFGTSAFSVMDACEELYNLVKAAGKPVDQVAAVVMSGTRPQKNNYGTNYIPVFEIVDWVDRPDAFLPVTEVLEEDTSFPPVEEAESEAVEGQEALTF